MSAQGNRAPRCFWCNAAEGDLVGLGQGWASGSAPLYTHPHHSGHAEHFISRTERLRMPFLVGFLTVLLLAPILAVLRSTQPEAGGIALGGYLVFVGAWLIALPFATPQTVRWLGARSATRLVRVLGVLILGAGIFTGLSAT